ncbi:unnamed protein product [Musa acuminata subsp. burmannicoides]
MRIPSEFGNLTKLTFLWMTSANLQGEIPASFAQLKGLTQLDLSQNSLTGAISAGIWGLPNLQYLYLYKNNLSGSVVIDGTIGALGLVEIDLSMNQLTGSIPHDFGKLKKLSLLYLYYNRLSGEIPASIGLLQSLTYLSLSYNSLTGVLPPELGKNSPLLDIEVDDNMISGEVPDGIWAAVNLTILVMNDNAFSGMLPHKLPPKLALLDIVNNRFTGKIPSSAPSLVVFFASNNMFSGELPSGLAGLSTLQLFYLGNNMISGRIPEDISSLKSLAKLNLRHNLLTGKIPTSIGSLKQLTSMDLSGNELSGSIPSEMGNLKLIYVNLSSNQLSGEIPVALQAEAYDQSFLSNPGLCASNSLLSVPTCATRDHILLSRLGLRNLLLALGALVFLTAATLFSICVIGKYRKRRHLTAWTLTPFHSLDFTKSDIVNGIKEENLIGVGGAGKVYRVTLGNRASEIVAAKKIWNGGNLDGRLEKQFQAELQILGSIRHKNIIKLLCCCSSLDSNLLVYEYMENGSLHKWLHKKHMAAGGSPHETPLDWPRRLEIAIGSARGLCYMHHDCSPPIIHRDVKSSNILLDSEFNVKIADFGLARMVAKPGEPDTASVIAGSHGYIAPECGYSRRLNEKVDVYSFGVVLLELTTGREAHDGGDDQCNLAEWSRRHLQQGGEPRDAVDPELRGSSHVDDMATVFELGVLCTETSPSQRPSMKEVSRFLMRCKRA